MALNRFSFLNGYALAAATLLIWWFWMLQREFKGYSEAQIAWRIHQARFNPKISDRRKVGLAAG
jgi:hypothetical protein